MLTDAELLARINADLPPLDWRQGALDYVGAYFETYGRGPVRRLVQTKPLTDITHGDPAPSIAEIAGYVRNFANAIELLRLPRDARILDVACGGGWFSHWLAKIGYRVLGIDISPDFIELARERLRLDPHLHLTAEEIEAAFAVCDLEVQEPSSDLRGAFDAVILESCLHHFFDPISALRHVEQMLKDDGVVLILEGENRTGAINPDYMKVMLETRTLERPYPRGLLTEVLRRSGLPHCAFMGVPGGFVFENSPETTHAAARLAQSQAGANNCVCAKTAEALRRVAPSYGDQQPTAGDPPGAPSQPEAKPPNLLRAGVRALRRRLARAARTIGA